MFASILRSRFVFRLFPYTQRFHSNAFQTCLPFVKNLSKKILIGSGSLVVSASVLQSLPDDAQKLSAKEVAIKLNNKLALLRSSSKVAWPSVHIEPIAAKENFLGFKTRGLSINYELSGDCDIGGMIGHIVSSFPDMRMNVTRNGTWACLQMTSSAGDMTVSLCRVASGGNPAATDLSQEGTKLSLFFEKSGEFTDKEIDVILATYERGTKKLAQSLDVLAKYGLKVYEPTKSLGWEDLAGMEQVKTEIESTLVLALTHPQVYHDINIGTRVKPEPNRPKAVLFEGPPGTGKTTSARIIASHIQVPLIYLPVERIMSMYYGESERILAEILDACTSLGDCIIFIDEIDSLATRRGGNMHEATRRLLSVLLRKIEGFEKLDKTVFIGATNRKQDLDEALLSRFDVSVLFDVPTEQQRRDIFKLYAKQLSDTDVKTLAAQTDGFVGRGIRDVCSHTERRWAAKTIADHVMSSATSRTGTSPDSTHSELVTAHIDSLLESEAPNADVTVTLPPVDQYIDAIETRKQSHLF